MRLRTARDSIVAFLQRISVRLIGGATDREFDALNRQKRHLEEQCIAQMERLIEMKEMIDNLQNRKAAT